jgi:AraC-like DNA-binding protein
LYIEHSAYNATNILQLLAHYCGGRATGDSFTIPHSHGEGYLHAYNFPSGISALVSDVRLKEEIVIKRNQHSTGQYFVLLFNEITEKPGANEPDRPAGHSFDLRRNLVRLSSSLNTTQSELAANCRVRTINIIFHKQALLNFLDFDTIEKLTNIYFSLYLKKNFVAAMDAEYRWIMQELFREIDSHPLQNLFIENRLMLLLEKFLYNFMVREPHSAKKLQFKEEEISRLVKAENMLLEDFSKTPPTISLLSKVCTMSPTKFKNDFKVLYGLPVYEYYQKNRMAYARALIQGGEHAIKEVGMMIGYSNLGHFAAAFKKEYNMLPSEWLHANRIHPMISEALTPTPAL